MESVQHQQLKNVPLRDMLLYFIPSRVNKYRGQNEQGSVFIPSFWIEASNPRFGGVVTESDWQRSGLSGCIHYRPVQRPEMEY